LKPYAIQEKDGKASPPIVFCEKKEVIHRLSQKFWPGPITLYLRITDDTLPYLPTHSCKEGKRYLGLSNPSHPLMNRFLKDTTSLSSGSERIVVGVPTSHRNQDDSLHYLTKADDVCYHYCSMLCPASSSTSVHVLDGEDKRELFAVPTCQYGMPSPTSLWIDDSIRTIYLRGTKDGPEDTIFSSSLPSLVSITQALELIQNDIPTTSSDPQNSQSLDERRKHRNRVVAAVLRKWKVIDQRTEA
jgi:Telomere recombination